MYPQVAGRERHWNREYAEILILDFADDHPFLGRWLIALARYCQITVAA